MPLSSVLYTANGSTTQFDITFSYIDTTHIKVFIDNVEDTSFTFVNTSRIQTSSTPSNGAIVKIGGLTLRQRLEKEFKSPRYDKLTDNVTTDGLTYKGSKQDMINKIIKGYRKKAKALLIKQNLVSENGMTLKQAVINDRKNQIYNKRGQNLLRLE